MHRQATTPWNEKKEIKGFRVLLKQICEGDMQLIERYYKTNWPPKTGHNHLRHDLATLINNWAGEVDRARIWCESHPIKQKPRVVIPMPPIQSEPYIPPVRTPEEQAAYERFMADYYARKGRSAPPQTFQDVRRIMTGEAG